MRLLQAAEDEAVRVFATNLRDLLLAAPAGTRATMGLDPGFRTGVKVAVVDATGKVVATDTIYPHVPAQRWNESLATLAKLAKAHAVELIAIGNGTASPGDRQARRRPDQAAPGAEAHQGCGVRGRRLGVLRLGVCLIGVARPGRVAARRGVHRPPPAGPPRGTREDRSRVHRRRVSTSTTCRVQAVALARRGCRRLRERGRCGRQHRIGPAADPGLRHRRGAGLEHRGCTATRTGRFGPGPRSRTCLDSGRRRSSSAPASCASAAATTRWTPPACTPRRTRWCGGSWPRPAGTADAHRQHRPSYVD